MQDLRRLRELDLGVRDDLHVVAPRVEERVAAEDLHPCLAGRGEHRVAVVDDEPEVACGVRALRPALGEGDELVAHVDERHPGAAAAQLEVEEATVERERLVDRGDLECDVVDPDGPGHHQILEVVPQLVGLRSSPFRGLRAISIRFRGC